MVLLITVALSYFLIQTFGDMNEINRYLRKAQALQTRLEAAAEKVVVIVLFILFQIYNCLLLYVTNSDSFTFCILYECYVSGTVKVLYLTTVLKVLWYEMLRFISGTVHYLSG